MSQPHGFEPEPQKVYVLEVGEYSQAGVCGVYPTPEDAMAGYPHGEWKQMPNNDDGTRWWVTRHGDTASVTEYEVTA